MKINFSNLFKLKKALLQLSEIATEEGVNLIVDGEVEVGAEVFVNGDEGLVPASDGTYSYDGKTYTVEGGIVTAIVEQGVPEPETDPETPAETEPETNPETPAETEPETEPETPAETEPETNPETPAETEPETDPETPAETEPETEPETPAETEALKQRIAELEALVEELKKKLEEPVAESVEEEMKKTEKKGNKMDYSRLRAAIDKVNKG